MGCKCSNQVIPVDESVLRPVELDNKDLRSEPVPIPDLKEPQSTRTKKTDHYDQSQDPIIPPPNPMSKEYVDIEVADPQAFNNSIIKQRQQAIENRSYRATIESWRPISLQQLVNAIKALSLGKSEIESHWIIFYWVTFNIEYDTVSYFSKNYQNQSAEGVFQTKKGVCAGYGNIYKYLCDQINLKCENVSGFSKGYGFDDREDAPSETDHAWNAIEIDQHWYLIESTWGAGHLDVQKEFKRQLNTYYFLPRPNEMIYHHLPEIDKWQLLREPITMGQYMKMPKIHPAYFELNLNLINPRHQAHATLLPDKAYAMVLVQAPSNVSLIASLKLHDKKIEGGHQVIFDAKKKVYSCYFAPASIGKHKITIYGKRGGTNADLYDAAFDLTLNTSRMPQHRVSFPETWPNFFDLNLQVISPLNTHLVKVDNGETDAEICIRSPADVEILGRLSDSNKKEVNGGDCVFYDENKDLWRCKFAPNRDGLFEATIMAKKKSDAGNYTSAISFKIEAKRMPMPPVSYPKTWQIFHDLGLKIEASQNRASAVWPENASYAEVRIRAPDDVHLSCSIEYNGSQIENGTLTQFDSDKQQWQLLFAPQRTGPHKLVIFARRLTDAGSSSSSAVMYHLNVTQLRQPMIFPLLYGKFGTGKCRLYEPLHGVLKKDSTESIHCVIPGATDVNLQVDSKWLKAEGYEDPVLKRQISVGSQSVVIYAKYGQEPNYDGLVKYSVE